MILWPHRELPDFITPYKHISTEDIAAIYDGLDNYCVDERTVIRVRHWTKAFLLFGEAMIRQINPKYPIFENKQNTRGTFETLTYLVRAVANANKWKFMSLSVNSG